MADWDERYRRGENATIEPNELLTQALDLLGSSSVMGDASARPRALDIACGAGRHALLLAARGFDVTAVDRSRVGVELTRTRAHERGLRLDARVADLESADFDIEPGAYDLICDFYYLQRDLFPRLRVGVKPGGLFVAAIHLVDEASDVKPMNPNFLLEPGELRAAFEDWEVLRYHETKGRDADAGAHTRRSAELIARRPA